MHATIIMEGRLVTDPEIKSGKNGDYLKNDADEVIYFAGVEAAKVYLREHGVTEDEMEDMVFRKSVGTCFRCGDPLFLSDIPEYTCQCFRCDEDFYYIEQDITL